MKVRLRQHVRASASDCEMSRVLVVEDEQHLADGLRFNLEAEGYQVAIVETGEEALQRLRPGDASFDVLVLDVMLPGQDGFAVISELRGIGQFIPTLMLTARGHPDDVLRGFAAGADDYLTKPFELSILIARIRGLLRRREWLEGSSNHVAPAGETKDVFTFGGNADKTVNFDRLELMCLSSGFRGASADEGDVCDIFTDIREPGRGKACSISVGLRARKAEYAAIYSFIVRLRVISKTIRRVLAICLRFAGWAIGFLAARLNQGRLECAYATFDCGLGNCGTF